jgi:cytochrome c
MPTSRTLLAVALLCASGAATRAADGNPATGEQIFKRCAVCHAIGPGAKIRVGPPLNGIVGRAWGAFPGFSYSQDIKDGAAAGKVWDVATLQDYVENPKHLAPHGKMAFPGLKTEQERADVISYLAQFDADGNKKP